MLGMSNDAKWIAGTGITLLLVIATFAGLIIQQLSSLSSLIIANMTETNKRLESLDARLRTVEQVQAQHSVKLDQLLGVAQPVETEILAESVSGW